ncbi:MAG: HAD family hydrolase [Polyangiales bacterium]
MIPGISVEAAIARIEAALKENAHVALATDGDGTLWTNDIGEALFDHVLHEGLVGEPAREALLAEAHAHGLDAAGDATAIARVLWESYLAHKYPEDRMCAAMAWCMAGMKLDALDAYCDDVLERRFGVRGRIIEESLAVVRWVAKRDIPLWLVSASPRPVVSRAARIIEELVSAKVSVVAMTPRVADGAIAVGIEGIWPYGEGKRQALDAALGDRTLVVALGDNVFDIPMLKSARVALAVRPKPALTAKANDAPGLLRLEP